jgi:pantetheine-phosphate adenylyltransferase/dephospho-CoA kinase
MSKAIYAFSGDPITFGHLDIIERAARVFDHLIVGIGVNPTKKYMFDLKERAELARNATAHLRNVEVVHFPGLVVDYAYENDIPAIIRGLRNSEDFNFEIMLHQIGASQKKNIDTFFIPTKQELSHVSSSAVKAVQLEQGLIHEYVPLQVKKRLEEVISGQHIIGVTGEIGAGKSFICEKLIATGKAMGSEVSRIDIDEIGHEILTRATEPLYVKFRENIAAVFGKHLLTTEGFIDVKKLGKIIFSDIEKLNRFNELLYQPLLLKLRRELYGRKGIILLDSALIAESRMTYLCNNNVVMVKTSKEEQLKRLEKRNYNPEQIRSRLASQYTYELKLNYLQDEINRTGCGKIFQVENNSEVKEAELREILGKI